MASRYGPPLYDAATPGVSGRRLPMFQDTVSKTLNCGTRCHVEGHGFGTVRYRRMAPPSYSTVEVYSVVLDSRRSDANYSGTIFPASKVTRCSYETALVDMVLGGAGRPIGTVQS